MASWDLFREMDNVHREMDDLFRGLGFGRLLEPSFAAAAGSRTYPRLNMREDQENVYVEAMLPGIDPKKLEMTVLKNTLTLAGERRGEEAGNGTWHRRERGAGRFLRTLDIPAEIEIDKVQAHYRDGMLTVTLPKAAVARPRQIEVKLAS